MFVLLQLEEAAERDRRPFGTQLFPFRTVAMILSLIAIPLISQIMVYLFNSNTLKKDQDYFMCIVNIPDDEAQVSQDWKTNKNKKMCENDVPFKSNLL